MRHFTLAALIGHALVACASTQPGVPDAGTGGRLDVIPLRSEVFGNTRSLRVWLPPGYDGTDTVTYPALYLTDGQNLFDRATAQFTGDEWQVDETAVQLIRDRAIQPFIVVGIDNAGVRDRPNEYLPWEDEHLTPPMPSPHGRDFPGFLVDEVIPLVESRYRVRSRADDRFFGGSSYGALIALYTATQRPQEFGGLLLESPSLYVNQARILDLAEAVDEWPARVYIGIGTHEGQSECRADNAVEDAVADVDRLESILMSSIRPPEVDVVVERCGLHQERYWAARLPRALRFLFREEE